MNLITQNIKPSHLRVATFTDANNVALSLVDNCEFRELIEELDPRYTVPH